MKKWARKLQIPKLLHLRNACQFYKNRKSANLRICYFRYFFADRPPYIRVGKNPGFLKKKPSPVVFLGFLGFFWVFWVFLVFFFQTRGFLGFFQFHEYF
jgi:hypothetical protein